MSSGWHDAARRAFPWMRDIRREVHRHPELSNEEHATAELVVTPGARSLPVSFNGAVPDSASSGRFADNLTVSKWGEAVRVAAPASSVPLSAILKNTTTTTTTPPVVV